MATLSYSRDGIEIWQGDCRDVLPTLSGTVVTDPPYNVGYGYDDYADSLSQRDYMDLLLALPEPSVLIHYPEATFDLALAKAHGPKEVIAWVYNANTPRQWRMVSWWGVSPDLTLGEQPYKNPDDRRVQQLRAKGKKGAQLYDWWHVQQVKNVSSDKTDHPCQIPVGVMERILSVTPIDGTVIDPFMGSGTTLRAAKNLGLKAIGIELSPRYVQIAIDRMRQEVLL